MKTTVLTTIVLTTVAGVAMGASASEPPFRYEKYINPKPTDPDAYTAYQHRLQTRRDAARRIVQQYNARKNHVYPIPRMSVTVNHAQTFPGFLPPTRRAANQPFQARHDLENRWVFVPSYVAPNGQRVGSEWRLLTVPKR